jgi:hypothetical protein
MKNKSYRTHGEVKKICKIIAEKETVWNMQASKKNNMKMGFGELVCLVWICAEFSMLRAESNSMCF